MISDCRKFYNRLYQIYFLPLSGRLVSVCAELCRIKPEGAAKGLGAIVRCFDRDDEF